MFGRYLCNATASEEAFNFSLAFATVQWIQEVLGAYGSTSSNFSAIAQGLSSLKEVVSLTTGTALFNIWRATRFDQPLSLHDGKVAELESADRRFGNVVEDKSK